MTALTQRIVSEIEAAWQYVETHREEIEQAIRIHRETQGAHPGIIVCTRDDGDPSAFAQRIHSSLVSCGNPTGQLIRIVRPSRS